MNQKVPAQILPVIVISQFAGTSLWFAGNAVVNDLIIELNLLEMFVGYITTAVQAGFILGTLVFAIFSVADRFSPVKVFLICCVMGAASNALTIHADGFLGVMTARTATGFFLAGIYPVGMKIASDWYEAKLGKALGYLVGALVIGTAFPHLLKYLGSDLPWRYIMLGTSAVALSGGLLLFFTVKDGPFHKQSSSFKPLTIFRLFKVRNFRSAAFGYFGHMWELYTFWAFVPVMLAYYLANQDSMKIDVSLFSFMVIGIGGIGCAILGKLSLKYGNKSIAMISLIISGLSCLVLPFVIEAHPILFLMVLFIWGTFVIPDSPQFSTMVAYSCEATNKATGLTIVNSIGFAITIISIQLVNQAWAMTSDPRVFWIMFIGPVLGLISISSFRKTT